MKVKIRFKNKDWKRDIQEAAMNTIRKSYKEAKKMTPELFEKYLISEHSPIRALDIRIYLLDISYYTSVHYARHIHSIPYVTSNRPDRTKKERSTNDTVDHIFDINPQGLIDMMRKRLCKGQCDPITYELAILIKTELMKSFNPYFKVLGKILVPNGVYRGFCPEFKKCGYCVSKNIIPAYDLYNQQVYR